MMPAKLRYVIVGAALLLVQISCLGSARAQATGESALVDHLKSQFKLARMGSDTNGWSVVEAGTVLVVQKGGMLGVPPATVLIPTATYKDGNLHPPNTFLTAMAAGQDNRQIPAGEKVYVTRIDVRVKNDKVSFFVVECDSCNGVQQVSSYKAAVIFQFPKGYLGQAEPSQIIDVISQVLAPETASNEQQQQSEGQPEPPPDPPASPPRNHQNRSNHRPGEIGLGPAPEHRGPRAKTDLRLQRAENHIC